MGFGLLYIFFIIILLPATGILLLTWLFTKKKIFGKVVGIFWLGIFGLIFLSLTVQWLTAKKELHKKNYYGAYIVDRDYFPGKQANWQYQNFRFEIRDDDSIFFYVTDKEKILKTYKGTITTTEPYSYSSDRLILNMEKPTHHIMIGNPTIYRNAWSFYMVFNSPKFKNVYFKKGRWKPISE